VVGAGDFSHPFVDKRESQKRCVIIISTDKGLCGGLNSVLMREAAKLPAETTFITAGRKASQFIARTKRPLTAEFTYKDVPSFSEARAISKFAQDIYLKGEVDRVDILFTKFVSTLVQKPEIRPLLPITEIKGVTAGVGAATETPAGQGTGGEYIFEPDQEHVLGRLLPHSMNFQVYQILLESKASEHSARMVAMKNATDNAKQFIKDLTLEYNKLRQANITKELLEISSAAMAMG